MEYPGSPLTTICPACGETGKFSCQVCAMVVYCSVSCRDKSVRQHRNECQIVFQQTINRIGDTLSKAITTFRGLIFDLNVTRTVKGSENMTVYVKQTNLLESGPVLFDLPKGQFNDSKDKCGVFCANWSGEALGYFYDLLDSMLKVYGPAVKIEEQLVQVHGAPYIIVQGESHTIATPHRVLKISSIFNGTAYIFDPAAAAWGRKTCVHVKTFQGLCHPRLIQTNGFGEQKECLKALAAERTIDGLVARVNWLAVAKFYAGIRGWMSKSEMTMEEFLRLPLLEFEHEQRRLLSNAATALSGFKQSNEYLREIHIASQPLTNGEVSHLERVPKCGPYELQAMPAHRRLVSWLNRQH